MIDLHPAATELGRLVAAVPEDRLDGPTPCAQTTVRALLDHVQGLATGLADSARKAELSTPPAADPARLAPDFRTAVPPRLAALADAWSDPAAWQGMTRAGGVDLPGEVCGLVTADELVVHAWDLAVATGQELRADPTAVRAAMQFAAASAQQSPDGVPGLFGPPVAVPDDASELDRLLATTGRDPRWKP